MNGADALTAYQAENNATSVDGLPALDAEDAAARSAAGRGCTDIFGRFGPPGELAA